MEKQSRNHGGNEGRGPAMFVWVKCLEITWIVDNDY
jgi:hypothetical protein